MPSVLEEDGGRFESEIENEDDCSDGDWMYLEEEKEVPLNSQFLSTIQHVRSIVRVFRRSALKNETLQKYVKCQFGTELKLIFDVKTRWNSLCDMLEQFLKLKDCIMKAMIDLKIKLQLDEDDFTKLENLVAALKLTKATVEVLCRRLQNQETDVSRSLYFN